MLNTNWWVFCARGKFWEKEPHTHSPPPLSVVGVSNNYKLLHKTTIYVTGDYNHRFYQHQLKTEPNQREHQLLIARPNLHISGPTENSTNSQFQDPTCISQHQPVDIKKSTKLYQQSILEQVHQLCTTKPITTTFHLNLYHQSHHPNMICSQRSIIKSTLNHMHNITKLTNKIPLAIHHTLHKPNTINRYTRPCSKTIPLIL